MCVYQNLLRVLLCSYHPYSQLQQVQCDDESYSIHSDSIENLFLRLHSFDAISLFVDILEYLSKRSSELSVDLHTQDDRHGAFGYSFSKTRPSRDLIRESFRLISDYDVDPVKSFYECFITRNSFHNKNLLKLIFSRALYIDLRVKRKDVKLTNYDI